MRVPRAELRGLGIDHGFALGLCLWCLIKGLFMNPVNPLLFAEISSMAVMDQKLQRMKLPFGLNLKNWLTIPQILRNGFMNLEFKVF